MKKITAWQAEDGTQFFNEVDCVNHEKAAYFRAWFSEHPIGTRFNEQPDVKKLRRWLKDNAEDIRGFLQPVVEPICCGKPMTFAEKENGWLCCECSNWLAGELK